MNWDANKVTAKGVGGMSGDAVFSEVEPIVDAITPVPGGVGGVTNVVLIGACRRSGGAHAVTYI